MEPGAENNATTSLWMLYTIHRIGLEDFPVWRMGDMRAAGADPRKAGTPGTTGFLVAE